MAKVRRRCRTKVGVARCPLRRDARRDWHRQLNVSLRCRIQIDWKRIVALTGLLLQFWR